MRKKKKKTMDELLSNLDDYMEREEEDPSYNSINYQKTRDELFEPIHDLVAVRSRLKRFQTVFFTVLAYSDDIDRVVKVFGPIIKKLDRKVLDCICGVYDTQRELGIRAASTCDTDYDNLFEVLTSRIESYFFDIEKNQEDGDSQEEVKAQGDA